MSQSARSYSTATRTDDTNRSTKKPSATLRPHYYTTFQNSCCGSTTNASSSTQSKDLLPIPAKFKGDAERILVPINELLIEELSKVASFTSVIPNIFFEKMDDFQIEKYLIDRVMLRTLEDAAIINWNLDLKKLYPIRTSGNGNCLLHAVLIAMIGVHDINLYLRDQLGQFMNNNKDLLKNHWRIERLKSDKSYGISTDDSKLDEEWKELCDLVHYENSEDGQAATHLHFLEAVHIFSISNMLCRPIIVLSEDVIRNKTGEAISVNDLYGIYLPILSLPSECINEPIVLAYDRSHFCPLQTSDTNRERISNNLLPLYSSMNHTLEQTLLPIRFLGDDGTTERSNNLIREYLRIKEMDHIFDSGTPAISILCAELGSKHLPIKNNFFLLYYDYVRDFFKIQKPKAIEEEQQRERQRELDEYVARHSSYDSYGRSIGRQDTSPTRFTDTQSRNRNSRSYDRHQYSDDIHTNDGYIPQNGVSYLENSTVQSHQSRRTPEYAKSASRDPTFDPGYYESSSKRAPAGDPDVFGNLTNNSKMTNTLKIQIGGTDSTLNQERPQSNGIPIPVEVIRPSSSSDNPRLTIYEQTRAPRYLCYLCDRPLDGLKSTQLCPVCDYKIRYPTSYSEISSRPTTGSRPTNMYLPSSNSGYSSVLSPRPKIRPIGRVTCPHCKNYNLSPNLTHDTEFRCSACQNPIPSTRLY